MQAVPSGSGRLILDAFEEQQLPSNSHGTHASGKALITAALSKMGLPAMRSGKVKSAMTSAPNTAYCTFPLGVLLGLSSIARLQTCKWVSGLESVCSL